MTDDDDRKKIKCNGALTAENIDAYMLHVEVASHTIDMIYSASIFIFVIYTIKNKKYKFLDLFTKKSN